MSSAQEIIAQLTAAKGQLERAQAKATAAAKHAATAHSQVAGALHGGSGQLAGLISQVQDRLEEIAGVIPPARQQIAETITKVKSLGN